MKPTQAVIDLSKKLWKLGVRKPVRFGDWWLGDKYVILHKSTPSMMPSNTCIPIWTSCDECIEWLRGKIKGHGEAIKYKDDDCEISIGLKTYRITSRDKPQTRALLKAMVEVSNNPGGDAE